jgi:hypothetical protein
LIIPLVPGKGRIFKVNFEKKENQVAVAQHFYKFTLQDSQWSEEKIEGGGETMTAFDVLDFFARKEFAIGTLTSSKAQAVYGYYFEAATLSLKSGDENEFNLLRDSIQDALGILQESYGEAQEETPAKLLQNMKDLKDAFELKNRSYFGITDTTTV